MLHSEMIKVLQDAQDISKIIMKVEGFDPESIGREFDGKIIEPKITVFNVYNGKKLK